ncbi:MAG: hypothetical protein D6725_01425 [Planctomycetota bacterium]|nr:MAG: hypothetical protein D6725_01425 [Planctomycetota bacterium]
MLRRIHHDTRTTTMDEHSTHAESGGIETAGNGGVVNGPARGSWRNDRPGAADDHRRTAGEEVSAGASDDTMAGAADVSGECFDTRPGRGPVAGWRAIASSSVLLGGVMTGAFYGLIHGGILRHPLVLRYFCGHPLEYVTTAFFFTGIATLAVKAFRLRAEYRVFRQPEVVAPRIPPGRSVPERAAWLAKRLDSLPSSLQQTRLVERVRDVCRYVLGPRGAAGLEEHLRYLAELAADNLHRSYALVRTITWAVPILGFLGTVIGITLAIANVTPDQLESSLGEVTGGLAVAFDTTALSLALSMTLVFATFVVERAEQSVLADVERFAIRGPLDWFCDPRAQQVIGPLAALEDGTADVWIERLGSVLERRMAAVDAAAERLLERWGRLLDEHARVWRERFATDAAEVLGQHLSQTAAARERWAEAVRESVDCWREAEGAALQTLREVGERLERLAGTLPERCESAIAEAVGPLVEANREVRAAIEAGVRSSAERAEANLRRLAELAHEHASAIQPAVETRTTLLQALHRLTSLLEQMNAEQGAIGRLQAELAENLATLRDTQTFEETLNSLSAAIQLLAARTRPHAA